jgi:hypothetical protein
MVRGWQPCLQALAAAATLTREALKLSQLQPITVYSPHRLADLLTHSSLSLSLELPAYRHFTSYSSTILI